MNTCIHIYIHTYTHKKYKPSQTGSEGGLGQKDVMLKVSVHRVFIFVKNFNFQNSTFFFFQLLREQNYMHGSILIYFMKL